MAKNSITDYSKTAASNTDIQSVDIAEGCLPSGINNAIREIMADLADMNDGTVTLTSPSFAAATITGDLTVDTNTLHVDSTNNRVGIGTSSPTSDLTFGGATPTISTDTSDGADTSRLSIGGGGGATSTGRGSLVQYHGNEHASTAGVIKHFMGNASGSYISWHLGSGSEAMRIDSSGRVGIGTTSPSSYAKLTLQGNGTETIPTDSLVQSNDSSTLQTIWNSDNAAKYSGIKLETRTSGASGWLIANEWKSTYLGDLVFRGRSGASSSAERMRITSGGEVQIGTSTSDTNKLFVYDSDASNSVIYVRQDGAGPIQSWHGSGGQERMRIDSSGNVGIGTSSPLAILDVKNATNEHIVVSGSSAYGSNAIVGVNDVGSEVGLGLGGSEIEFYTGATERMRIDGSGNVGIGTTSPVHELTVKNGTQSPTIRIHSNTTSSPSPRLEFVRGTNDTFGGDIYSDYRIVSDSGSLIFQEARNSTTQELMRIDSSGNVTLGAGGTYRLDINAPTSSAAKITCDNTSMEIGTFDNHVVKFLQHNTERMRIDSSGNLAIGKTASSGSTDNGHLIFASGVQYYFAAATTNINRFYNSTTGSQVGSITVYGSSVGYNTTSDYRLKENVTGITDGIERVKQLNPSRFNFIADADTTVDGFLAHEAATVVPEAVHGEKDAVDEDGNPEYQGIDQAKLVPLLTAALQEAITKIEDLEARVATLEGN